MGKIIASYLVKLHLHETDGADEEALAKASKTLTNEIVKDAVITGLGLMLPHGADEVTVSLIERTDAD